MSRYENNRAKSFLDSLPTTSIESTSDTLTARCKFNFSYFEKQAAGQAFQEWTDGQLAKLLDKLKEYSREHLNYWREQRVGKSGTVLAIYGDFPTSRSDFSHPRHVPHEAQWGRFRLEQAVRLIGFVLPNSVRGLTHPGSGIQYDVNTFYVVFLDADHRFYKTELR
ncbi:MAG TPA: hypothetical protein VIG68_04695 [Lysobacter sp.]